MTDVLSDSRLPAEIKEGTGALQYATGQT